MTLSNSVLEIIWLLSIRGGVYIGYLMNHDEFFRLLIRALYGLEKELIRTDRVITIIQVLLSAKEMDVEAFLISQGLIFFILN